MGLYSLSEVAIILAISSLYIVLCPFNKVEESFNTHAVHDIIHIFPYKLPYQNKQDLLHTTNSTGSRHEPVHRGELPWDHLIFPGVVPRTFLGALITAMPMKLLHYLVSLNLKSIWRHEESYDHLTVQFVLQLGSRFTLSTLLALSLSHLMKVIRKQYGVLHRTCFLLTTVSQFHYLYYGSRFIPNSFAAILSNYVFAALMERKYSKSIIFMSLCAVIFRFDTALFFGCLLVDITLIRKQVPFSRALIVGIVASISAILLSLIVDSFFWTRLVWPELESIYYNVWLNKSSDWGTQPYLWYMYSCLPRMLMSGAPFILFARQRVSRDYLVPTITFLLVFSILPHKEMRFILFVVPLLNICIADGIVHVYQMMSNFTSLNRQIRRNIATVALVIGLIAMLSVNSLVSFKLTRIAVHNYPGGLSAEVVATSPHLIPNTTAVYVDNLAAQTGFSRFLQVDGVFYSKTPSIDDTTFTRSYDQIFLVLEPKEIIGFFESNCRKIDRTDDKELIIGETTELSCNIPNQEEMTCIVEDTIQSFHHVDMKKLMSIDFTDDFFHKKPSLHVLRCSNL